MKRRGTETKCICVNLWWKQSRGRAREFTGDTRVRQRENVRGDYGRKVCGAACEKKIERKRDTDTVGYHGIYERKQGTRNRMAAGGTVEVRERERENDAWEEESLRAGRGGKMRKRDRGTPGETRLKKRTYAQWALGREGRERREDEGVERDSAVISEREEACGCDVRRPC